MNQQCFICQVSSNERKNLDKTWLIQTHTTKKEQYDREWLCLNTFSEKLCMITYVCQYSQDNDDKCIISTT